MGLYLSSSNLYVMNATATRVYIMNELTCLYAEQDADCPEKYLNI